MSDQSAEREPSAARNIYAFGITSFLNDTASEMAYWVLPAFLASLGAGPAQLGLIEGVAESVASFAKLFSGYLADHIERRKPVVVAGYFVANAVKPLLAVVTAWPQILLIRFTDRLAKGVRGAPRDVMVAESVPKNRLGSAYGLIQSMDSAGAIAGPLAALVLLARFGIRSVFWAAAVPGALCVLVALLGIRETRRAAPGGHPLRPRSGQPRAAVPTPEELRSAALSSGERVTFPASFYFVLVAVTLFSLGNSSDMFLVLRAQNVGIPVALAPLLGLVFNITYTLASWPAGWFSDRVSRRLVGSVGYVIFAGVYFVFGRASSTLAIWIAMAIYGFYNALTQPVLKALVVETVGENVRGRALGIYFFVTSVATLAASLVTGELWKHYGAAIPFYFSAALALLAAGLLQGARRGSERASEAKA
ncbi:MAG TPA: MFS transporter [Candidatus Dormibacteraeota bacterium]|nr:MFS transporter [Candidatus Dormibacteraeota bacterium]